jgi:hypothetical protein
MDYRNDNPFMPMGVELDQFWFCGGRIGAALGRHGGLTSLVYYGSQPMGRTGFFRSADPVAAFFKLFRICILVDGVPYHPTFRNTELHPFGFRSEGLAGAVRVRHELVLINDAVVQRVRILRNPSRAAVALRLVWHGGPSQVGMNHRTWSPFAELPETGVFATRVVDDLPPPDTEAATKTANPFGTQEVRHGETHIAVGSDLSLAFQTLHDGFKYHADSAPFEKQAAFIVGFASSREALLKRMAELRRSAHTLCDAKFAAAARRTRRQPEIRVAEPALQSFLAQLPETVDALRVEDIPGAMRASAGHYWVWGWDSIVYSKGLMLAGRGGFVREMLEFYRSLAHPKLGIAHAFTLDLKPASAMAFNAQCLYSVMLYNHYCVSRDLATLKEYYPFARWIVEQAMKAVVGDTGLVEGKSLFPDFPRFLGHDGHDLSVFNNSIYYQALRSLADLTRVLADSGDATAHEFQPTLAAAADRCQAGFHKVFFDVEAGYFVDSASSRDLVPRRHHPSYAVLWVTPYAADLVRDDLPRIAAFMTHNYANTLGIFMFPLSEPAAFYSDGNQTQQYFPVVEPFYWNVMSLAGKARELAAWTKNVKWYWDRFTIPEGLTFDAVNAGDLAPDCPGGKQPFSGKAWYEIFFTAYAGVDVTIDGLALRPTPVKEPVEIRNLVLAGRRVEICISGRGTGGIRVKLNGKPVADPGRIPFSALRPGTNRIEAIRTGKKAG